MKKPLCSQCSAPNPTFKCLPCNTPLCKRCSQFVDLDMFEWLSELPGGLKAGAYCNSCFTIHAQPEIDGYQVLSEKAGQVALFEISQSKETSFFKRNRKPFQVTDCADRREAETRLSFMAAQGGFHALIDIDLRAEKVHTGGSYKRSKWSGSAMPIDVDPAKLRIRK